ncbi:MAG: palmitoyltransferase pfa5 [Chaenotheca gracillima]|nr:MAG: palmitoyltransferase pfa5 [Chaenotheca gracillima]
MAIYIAESKKTTGSVNVHWAIVVGLAGLLGIFAGGMSLTSIHLAIINSTTIDNLSRKTKVMQLAVRISLSLRGHIPPTVLIATPQTMLAPPQDPADGQTAIPLESSNSPTEFAILRTSPGDNPWDLGYYRNWKTVMGNHWIDWFVPLNRSPCCDHSGAESAYELGPVVERLKQEAGLITPQSISHPHTRKRRHRRGSRSGHGSAPGSEDTARSDNARSEEKRHRRRKRERRRAMDRRT